MQRTLRLSIVISLLILAVGCSRDPVSRSNRLVTSGNKFFDQGKYKEATIQYRRAIQQNPKAGTAYYRLGLASVKLQDLSTGASAFRRALDTNDPKSNEFRDSAAQLGDIYWLAYLSDQRKYKSLLADIADLSKKLLTTDPKSYDGLRLDGYLQLAGSNEDSKPNLEAALGRFRQALQAKPYQPEMTLILVQTLLASKQPEEAEKIAKDFLTRNKQFPPIYDQLFAMYLTTNRKAEAEKTLRDKVDNNPKQEMFYISLAAYYLAEKRTSEMESTLQRLTANPKDFPAAHLTIGRFFFRLRDFDRAGREFEEGVKADSKNQAVYKKAQVELMVAQGKYVEARNIVDDVLKTDAKDEQAIQMRSALRLLSRNPAEITTAVNELQALVTKNPQNPYYRLSLGRALLASGQPDAARTHLEEANRLRPDLVEAKVMLAQILIAKGESARGIQLTEDVLRVQPRHLLAHLLRSSALIAMGERGKAKEELEAVLKDNPKSADAKFQLARVLFDEKNYKAAETAFRELQELAPNDNRGLVGLVETKVATKDFDGAVKLTNDAIARDPSRIESKLFLANVMVRAQRFDEGIKLYKEVIHASPKSPRLYLMLGETYRLKGDLNGALDNFRLASSMDAADTESLTRLAMILDGLGRRDEAKPIYEKVLRVRPDDGVALNNLAYIKAEEGSDLDSALSLAERARQKFPTDPNVADTLGWIYIKKNLSEDAVRVFTELVTKVPKNSTYRYHLAMALLQKGDKPRARKECETALQNNPTKEEVGKIKTLLQRIG